jgi:hypothetical protein
VQISKIKLPGVGASEIAEAAAARYRQGPNVE